MRLAAKVAPPPPVVRGALLAAATEMELASAATDFVEARRHLVCALVAEPPQWMRVTTSGNLRIHAAAFADDESAVAATGGLIAALE